MLSWGGLRQGGVGHARARAHAGHLQGAGDRHRLFLVGSFIAATSFEFDGRAGRVHDVIFDAAATWLKTLAREACTAIEPGEVPARRDPTQITFELNPISIGAKLVSCTVIPAAPGAVCIQ